MGGLIVNGGSGDLALVDVDRIERALARGEGLGGELIGFDEVLRVPRGHVAAEGAIDVEERPLGSGCAGAEEAEAADLALLRAVLHPLVALVVVGGAFALVVDLLLVIAVLDFDAIAVAVFDARDQPEVGDAQAVDGRSCVPVVVVQVAIDVGLVVEVEAGAVAGVVGDVLSIERLDGVFDRAGVEVDVVLGGRRGPGVGNGVPVAAGEVEARVDPLRRDVGLVAFVESERDGVVGVWDEVAARHLGVGTPAPVARIHEEKGRFAHHPAVPVPIPECFGGVGFFRLVFPSAGFLGPVVHRVGTNAGVGACVAEDGASEGEFEVDLLEERLTGDEIDGVGDGGTFEGGPRAAARGGVAGDEGRGAWGEFEFAGRVVAGLGAPEEVGVEVVEAGKGGIDDVGAGAGGGGDAVPADGVEEGRVGGVVEAGDVVTIAGGVAKIAVLVAEVFRTAAGAGVGGGGGIGEGMGGGEGGDGDEEGGECGDVAGAGSIESAQHWEPPRRAARAWRRPWRERYKWRWAAARVDLVGTPNCAPKWMLVPATPPDEGMFHGVCVDKLCRSRRGFGTFAQGSGPCRPGSPRQGPVASRRQRASGHAGGTCHGSPGSNGRNPIDVEIVHPFSMPAGEVRVHDSDGYVMLIGQMTL